MMGDSRELQGNRPFRFLATWMDHKDFKPFLQRIWAGFDKPLQEKIQRLQKQVQHWNRRTFDNIFLSKEEMYHEIEWHTRKTGCVLIYISEQSQRIIY